MKEGVVKFLKFFFSGWGALLLVGSLAFEHNFCGSQEYRDGEEVQNVHDPEVVIGERFGDQFSESQSEVPEKSATDVVDKSVKVSKSAQAEGTGKTKDVVVDVAPSHDKTKGKKGTIPATISVSKGEYVYLSTLSGTTRSLGMGNAYSAVVLAIGTVRTHAKVSPQWHNHFDLLCFAKKCADGHCGKVPGQPGNLRKFKTDAECFAEFVSISKKPKYAKILPPRNSSSNKETEKEALRYIGALARAGFFGDMKLSHTQISVAKMERLVVPAVSILIKK